MALLDTSGRLLERTIAPGAYLPRDAQVELATGLATVMQNQTAMLAEAVKALNDIKVNLGAQVAYGSTVTAGAARTALRGVVAASADIRAGASRGPGVVASTEIPQLVPKVPMRPSRVVSTGDARHVMDEAEDVRVATYRAGRERGLQGVREVVAARVARSISEMELGADQYEGVEVPIEYAVSPGQTLPAEFPQIAEGTETRMVYRERNTGRVLDAYTASRAARSIARSNAVRSAVGAMGAGGGLSAGVKAAAPRLAMGLGYAGLAVGAAQQAYGMYTDQLAANRPYQQVLGGGITEGFGERFSQNAFRIRNALSFSPIGSAQSEEIYQGALKTYAGDRDMRGVAQGVMSDLYRSTGMSPQQSLEVIQIAAREGNTALGTLAQSLKGVTETAREAGINAEEARGRFTATYRALSETIGGAGAAALASAQTQAVTSMGAGYQGIGIDSSQTRMMVLGAMNGMNPGQVQNMATSDPLGFAKMDDAFRRQEAERLLGNIGATPEIAAYLRRIGKTNGQGLNRKEMEELGGIVNATAGSADVVQGLVQNQLGMTGTTTANAGEALVAASFGQPDVAGELADQLGSFEAKSVNIAESTTGENEGTGQMGGALGLQGGATGPNQERWQDMERLMKDMGFDTGMIGDVLNATSDLKGQKGAIQRYVRQVAKTGQRNPVLERLLTDYEGGRRYKVSTSGGEKVVGNFELIESFSDQAQAGDVAITKGSGKGGTIEEMLGVDLHGYAEDADSAKRKYTGKTFDDDEGKSASGEITINAGPELRRWIDISATGAASYNSSRAGTPVAGPGAPDQRATG